MKNNILVLSSRKVDGTIKPQIYLTPDQLKIIDFLDQMGRMTAKDVEDVLSCPKRTAQSHVQKLKKIKMTKTIRGKRLDPMAYAVTQEGATEPPFTGRYFDHHETGIYRCIVCGVELFSSETKFESGTGWPSFTNPINLKNIELIPDTLHGMVRTEVKCKTCMSHLGHVFDDGPRDQGGKRYCINSCVLDFQKNQS